MMELQKRTFIPQLGEVANTCYFIFVIVYCTYLPRKNFQFFLT
jgi:hypothetical protein